MRKILFLGTGNGMPIASTCSSMLVEDEKNNILFDAAGGHDILARFNDVKEDPTKIKNILITHYDSDHILGIVPLVRTFHRWAKPQKRNIFCSPDVKNAIDSLFKYVAKKHYDSVKDTFNFVVIKHGTEYEDNGWKFNFFDVKSPASPQMGCVITFPDGTKLSFLGDEPLRDHYLDMVKDCDVLIHDAFCLDTEQEIYKPHPKNHSTVKEAALNATKLNAKKLVLYHMEDKTLKTRKTKYLKEVKQNFSGDVFVPLDGDQYKF